MGLTLELPLWRFHDLIDLLSGKLNHIAPDIKPSEGPARYSADNPLSLGSACSAMESSWKHPRSYPGHSYRPLHPFLCVHCQ